MKQMNKLHVSEKELKRASMLSQLGAVVLRIHLMVVFMLDTQKRVR